MAHGKRMIALLMAAMIAFSAAGCAAEESSSAENNQSQLWVVNNAVDVQKDYVMENPSASGSLTTPMALRQTTKSTQTTQKQEETEEVRAIWLSYLDLKAMLLTSGDQSEYPVHIQH